MAAASGHARPGPVRQHQTGEKRGIDATCPLARRWAGHDVRTAPDARLVRCRALAGRVIRDKGSQASATATPRPHLCMERRTTRTGETGYDTASVSWPGCRCDYNV